MLMHQLLYDAAARRPDQVAFHWVDRDKALTFGQAATAMEHLAGALYHLGVRKGDRVTILAHNGLDYVLAMFACWRIGSIAALVNVRFADELEYYLGDHQPVVAIYTHDMSGPVQRAAAQVASIRRLVCMDGPQPGAESLPQLLEAKFTPPHDPADEDGAAHLSYTSGTTGKPKGACLAHEPTMRAASCIAERLRLSSEDVSFGPTALSSSYQLVGNLLPPLHRGATVHVMGGWTQISGWDALEKTGATVLVANPTLLTELLMESRVRGRIPGKLRVALSGGAGVAPTLKRAWRDEWKLPLAESYGQSELGGFIALGEPVLLPDEKLAAAGRPLPDKEVRILDASGHECPTGTVGEVCLRGGFMKGYWGKPEKTAEVLRDGWLHSGDAGAMDADGYITMRGRFAELITVAGRTWFPRDLEEALCTHPSVEEAAVIGVPDAVLGQRPVAFVKAVGSVLDGEEVKATIRPLVPYDLTPLLVKTVQRFPMTPTGKIAKAELH